MNERKKERTERKEQKEKNRKKRTERKEQKERTERKEQKDFGVKQGRQKKTRLLSSIVIINNPLSVLLVLSTNINN